MWARAFNHAASAIETGFWEEDKEDRHIQTFSIRFPASGHKILAMASVPSKLRGRQGVLVGDEAAFQRDLKGLIKAAMAFLLWGGKVRLLSTHDGVDNAFNELIQDVRAGKRKGVVHRTTFQEAVEQGLYQRVCMRRGIPWTQAGQDAWVADAYSFYAEDAAEELDVVPSQSGGAFLPMSLIEARMSPDTPIVRGKWTHEFALLPKAQREAEVLAWCEEQLLPHLEKLDERDAHGVGEDFGRVADLSVLCVAAETRDLVRRCRLWVELSNCPFEQQRQIYFYLCDRLPRFRSGVLDATGNGAYLAEVAMQRYGIGRIEPLHLSEPFYMEQMPRFKAALQDGTFDDLPRDREVRDDLRALRVIKGVPKLPSAPTQVADGPKLRRHGDGAIAAFLADYAMRREVAPIEWTAVPAKVSRWDQVERDHDRPAHDDDIALQPAGAW